MRSARYLLSLSHWRSPWTQGYFSSPRFYGCSFHSTGVGICPRAGHQVILILKCMVATRIFFSSFTQILVVCVWFYFFNSATFLKTTMTWTVVIANVLAKNASRRYSTEVSPHLTPENVLCAYVYLFVKQHREKWHKFLKIQKEQYESK